MITVLKKNETFRNEHLWNNFLQSHGKNRCRSNLNKELIQARKIIFCYSINIIQIRKGGYKYWTKILMSSQQYIRKSVL